jgi:hypothetical protein
VSNIRRLAAGETILLGTINDWMKPAINECRFTLAVIELFTRSESWPVDGGARVVCRDHR